MQFDLDNSRTLSETVEFKDRKFIGVGDSVVRVHPAETGGIRFVIGEEEVPYDEKHVFAYKLRFSHLLTLARGDSYRVRLEDLCVFVPEHLRSALYLAGIDNARIEVEGRIIEENKKAPLFAKLFFGNVPKNWGAASMPILGGACGRFYEKIIGKAVKLDKKRETYRVVKEFDSIGGGKGARVFPSGRFQIIVNAMPGDKYGLNPERLEINDVYRDAQNHIYARGISRPPKWREVVRALDRDSFELFENILSANSYLRIHPKMPEGEKLALMTSYYRKGRNEPFAHMAVSDFLGELAIFYNGNMQGEFVFEQMGGGHTGRLRVLREMKEKGIIQRV